MNDILAGVEHKTANSIFILLNVLAALVWILTIVATTAFFTVTDAVPNAAFSKFVTGAWIFVSGFSFGVMMVVFAQVVRYLAVIADSIRDIKSISTPNNP